MSLINDVLRDLDRRGVKTTPAVSAPAAPDTRTSRRATWHWWLLSAVVLGVLLHLAWRDLGHPVSESETVGPTPPVETPLLASPVEPPVNADKDAQTLSEALDSESAEPGARPPDSGRDEATTAMARGSSAESSADPVEQDAIEPDPIRTDNGEPVIRIERAESGSPPQPLLAAQRALARGQADLARQHLESRLEVAPEDHDARLLLARIHQQAGRDTTAVRVLEAGLEYAQATPIVATLARQRLQNNQPEQARDLLLAHVGSDPTDSDYQLLLAAALRQTGQDEQALEIYRDLVDTSPHRGQAWIGLGSTLETLNQPRAARDAYRRALQADDPRAMAFARSRLAALHSNEDAP